ncbi:MAG: response regulator [Candidatus Eremiobacteraeota bacterium]|nr:response regulator [Candidatus Eremiobacteraeota bacterium]MCW5869142.1 response regulator [Candidatus Eremiobacteraeota bacterium]
MTNHSEEPPSSSAEELTRGQGAALTGLVQFGVLLILVIQFATALWTLYLFHEVNVQREWTRRSLQVQTILRRLESDLYEAESNQRGYLFTGSPALLDAYEASSDFTVPLKELRALLQDRVEVERCDQLHGLLGAKRLQMNRQNALLNTGSAGEAQKLLVSGEGPLLRESIRSILSRMTKTEQDVLADRQDKQQRAIVQLEWSLMLGLVLVLLTGVTVIRVLAVKVAGRFVSLEHQLALRAREYEAAYQSATHASQAKSDFLARMSHEIRTPMNGILGMVGHLRKTSGLTSQQKEYADLVHQSANNLLVILNDVLDFSKIEADALTIEELPYSPAELVPQALAPFVTRCAERQVALWGKVGEIPEQMVGDSARVLQVLLNLISNAVKFTEAGSVRLEAESDQDWLTFRVSDTGCGIAPESLSEVFEPFTQANTSIHRRFGGTGLGLAICQRLVAKMGGSLEMASQPGQGTVCTLKLPLNEARGSLRAPRPVVSHCCVVLAPQASYREAVLDALRRMDVQVYEGDLQGQADFWLVDPLCLGNAEKLHLWLKDLPSTTRVALLPGLDLEDPRVVRVAAPLTTLSLWSALQPVEPAPLVQEDPGVMVRHGMTALLAEDNPIGQTVMRLLLEERHFKVSCVEDGQDAVEKAREENFDVIFMDVQMPRMDGLEATRLIRQMEEDLGRSQTIIVALTAQAFEQDRKLCLDAGMNEFLAKPIVAPELERILLRIQAQ